jgi:hypothetical protein
MRKPLLIRARQANCFPEIDSGPETAVPCR